ncbi:MAG: preprotein translocase subunit SecG [Oscillospiraceae bacterium]|nr:preprotein translocase subunit SecG [Oscillospiraceae bacterium]
MSSIEIFLGSLLVIFSVAIVAVVLFQEGKQQTMGGVITGGGGETFLGKNKSRSIDAFLARWTTFIAVVMFLLVILVNIVAYFKWF